MLNRLFAVLVVPLATACGGGGSPPPVIVDSPPDKEDSPAALECPPTGLAGAIGTDADPAGPDGCGAGACDWYQVPTMGPNTGVNTFAFAIGIEGTDDQLQFDFASPFLLNMPQNFLTDATSTTAFPASAAYLQVVGGNVERLMFPMDGTITLTAQSDALNGLTKGTISMTNFREIDQTTGADVAGGCTNTVNGLTFVLEQGVANVQKPTRAPGTDNTIPAIKGRLTATTAPATMIR